MKRLIFFILIALSIVSCERTSADFTFEEETYYFAAPAKVKLINLSENADEYYWDFGDGTTSRTKTPTHTFEESGTYTVSLTAISEGGKEKTVSKEVVINNPPEKVLITGVTVNKAPLVDSQGNNWDDESEGLLPDIFVEINNGASVIYASTEEQYLTDVASTEFPLSFIFNQVYEIPRSSFSKRFYLDIEDKDEPVNKVISYETFVINQATTSQTFFPYIITLENQEMEVDLLVNYE